MQQLALAPEPDERPPGPELVASAASIAPHPPEQLPLIRMLEVVTRKIDSLDAGQRMVRDELKEIRQNLPLQRKPLSKRTQSLHVHVTWSRRNGLCPCCQARPVCTETGHVEGAEYDHWLSRHQARVSQTWLICGECNERLRDTDFKASMRSAFESYQLAIRAITGGRQLGLELKQSVEKGGKE